MKLFKRLSKLVERKISARQYGITFRRASCWHIPDKLTFLNRSVVIKSPKDLGSDMAFLDIFLDDCYLLKKLVDKNINNILDIGGHIGLFSSYARTIFHQAKIHSYEPNPNMSGFIQHQAANFNFSYFLEAVGSTFGKVSIVEDEDSVKTSTLNDPQGSITQTSFCEVISRVGGTVDLLKLDCEGAEWDIFESEKDCWNKVKNLTMEYHLINGHSRAEVASKVIGLGFKIIHNKLKGPTWGLLVATR